MAPNVNGLYESERCAKLCSSQVLAITKTISPTEFRQEFLSESKGNCDVCQCSEILKNNTEWCKGPLDIFCKYSSSKNSN